uniref:Very-long-chain (3R)-3-hydroxyacyl-CoA dehydratase n=2 Tax=Clytia hemisphaerica TaxID=252671 RepID=A0A7M5XBA9_9CNID
MSSETSEKTLKSPPKGDLKITKVYLILYNVSLIIGWGLIFLKAMIYISEKNSFSGLYNEVEFWLKVSQTAALLELLHSIFGLVRSSIFTTLPQVASRIFVLWFIVDPLLMQDEVAKESIGFPMLLFAWSITEIVRYSFYANALMDNVPYSLQWCRYTFFLVLYPMGVTGELISIYHSIPYATKTGKFSIRLPNKLNFGFDFVWLCYVLYPVYIPGFYHLFTYMLRQRKKVLGKPKAE